MGNAPLELNGTGTDLIQKISVMGDNEGCAGKGSQILFQPLDGFDIQMIRGLVQQQKIRFLQQQLTQRHTRFLTAGKIGDRSVYSFSAKPSPLSTPRTRLR